MVNKHVGRKENLINTRQFRTALTAFGKKSNTHEKTPDTVRNCLKGLFVGEISEFRAKAMKPDEGVYGNIRQGGLNGLQPKF